MKNKLILMLWFTITFFQVKLYGQHPTSPIKDSLTLEEQIEYYEEQDRIEEAIQWVEVKEVEPEPEEEIGFNMVHVIPRLTPECINSDFTTKDLLNCNQNVMLDFIYKNLKYPESARVNKTEGEVIIQFTIGTRREVRDIQILKDIGDGCGEEAERLIKMFDEKEFKEKWQPDGRKSRHNPIRVEYKLGIDFRL